MTSGSLGSLEKKVMDIVWECGRCSGRQIEEKLRKKRKIAYTTVATILQRLYAKGLVERSEKGIAYIYSPKLSKESYARSVVKSFFKRFVGSFGDAALVSFAGSIEKLPAEKRKYFLKLLSENETKP